MKYIGIVLEYILQKDFFINKRIFVFFLFFFNLVYLIIVCAIVCTIVYIFSLSMGLPYSYAIVCTIFYKTHNVIYTMITLLSVLLVVLNILLVKIKKMYDKEEGETTKELNETIEAVLSGIFGQGSINSELLTNFYMLKIFLDIINNKNEHYIVFGKLDKSTYEKLYIQFCDLSDAVLWTKDKSFVAFTELESILNKNNIKHNKYDIFTEVAGLTNSLTTEYDDQFLKSHGKKIRVLIVDKYEEDNLKSAKGFLNMIGTDPSSLEYFTKTENLKVLEKRMKDFKGDSDIYIIEKTTLCCSFEIQEDELEFGVYKIGESLYSLKTKLDVTQTQQENYNVTIKVHNNTCAENAFFEALSRNSYPTYDSWIDDFKVDII